MTIFDYLKNLIVTKNKQVILDQYIPFLVTRWLSFINQTVCSCLNLVNKQIFLENKELHYKFLLTMFPKMKTMPRIQYIKKVKIDKEEQDPKIKIVANQLELSIREVQHLMELNNNVIS